MKKDDELVADFDLLSNEAKSVLKLNWNEAISSFKQDTSVFILGRGTGHEIAQEAALKPKETCQLHAESYSAADVQHGPMKLATSGLHMIAFIPNDTGKDGVIRAAWILATNGSKVFIVNGVVEGCTSLPTQNTKKPYLPKFHR
ncbi:MAG: hypothetical protein COB24_02015 [Hyphomicrobiales bacterium]|nr:MAG: hypothetical protein COB24_02015 [Hyphomicrobiales bacterium]